MSLHFRIKALTTTANTQPKTPKPPRRSKSGPSAPKAISSRAFLTTRVEHEESRSPSPVAQASATTRPSPPAATVLSSPPCEQLPCTDAMFTSSSSNLMLFFLMQYLPSTPIQPQPQLPVHQPQ